jgi:serine/threonine-protein kinase
MFPQVSGYRIRDKLPPGNIGVVYAAERLDTGQMATLRAIPVSRINRKRLARFTKQVSLATRSTAGRVLPLLETVAERDLHYIVFPFISGKSLAQIIKERRSLSQSKPVMRPERLATLPVERFVTEALTVLDQIIAAVSAVHDSDAFFPDLGPSNCLIDPNGEAWLTDFGISRLVPHWGNVVIDTDDIILKDLGALPSDPEFHLGRPGFIAPEEWAGRTARDARKDVFVLGIIIFQTLTLALPYGTSPILTPKPVPSVTHLHPFLAPEIDRILTRALAFAPGDRYACAGELWRDWQMWRQRSWGSGGSPPEPVSPSWPKRFKSWLLGR